MPEFLKILAGLCTAALIGCGMPDQSATTATTEPGRPNIIFILVDDLGWGDVGYLDSEIKTPNIDALAASGITLLHSYAFPICSPTRAAIMTGRNPLQFGVDGPMENDAMLPEQLVLLPEYLRQAGYETWMVGKWHLGMAKRAAAPPERGFNHFYGHLGGFIDFYTHVYFGGLDWQRNGQSVREDGYSTDLLTTEAIRLLNEYDADKPFFLYLAYNAPHSPLQYPPSSDKEYTGIADPDRRVFAQMTTYLDTSIGKLMNILKDRHLLDNSLVVFMSDNGGNLEAGAHNGDLRGGKGSAFDGGVRVPTVVAWPRELAGSQVSQHPIFAQDWLPTLLDVADVPYSKEVFDGISVWPALARNEATNRGAPVVIGTAKSKAVFNLPWKLVRNKNSKDDASQDQLFNIYDDPGETVNLADLHPELVQTLGAVIDELPVTESKGARGPPPESFFRDSSGAFDYDIRLPETREPWAEAAIAQ